MIQASTEVLHHFTCSFCMRWWSIASDKNYKPEKLVCPHCGIDDEVEYIEVPETEL